MLEDFNQKSIWISTNFLGHGCQSCFLCFYKIFSIVMVFERKLTLNISYFNRKLIRLRGDFSSNFVQLAFHGSRGKIRRWGFLNLFLFLILLEFWTEVFGFFVQKTRAPLTILFFKNIQDFLDEFFLRGLVS